MSKNHKINWKTKLSIFSGTIKYLTHPLLEVEYWEPSSPGLSAGIQDTMEELASF